MFVESLITDHLDIWTSAIETRSTAGRGRSNKLNLYGIKKLRELILELAVRGQLVPQDPADEPASVLLEKIAAEKARLFKAGKLKKQEPLPPIADDEKPFELPEGWEWSRFGDATVNRDGERKPVSSSDRQNMQGEYDYYGASGVIDQVNDYLFDKSLLLIGEDGANLINRSTPIAFIATGKYWVNNHAHVIDGVSIGFLRYLELFINAISLEPYITGTAQPKMNQAKMNSIPIAIPPEAEQHRIVAKVNELMSLCDALEQAQESSINDHQRLVENLLAELTQKTPSPQPLSRQAGEGLREEDAASCSPSPAQRERGLGGEGLPWQRIATHFDTLFTTEHSIDQLKQTILQLAVMSKLVPQDPTDEPASVLLEKIAAEKARLVKTGKLKKEKPLPPITEDEKPFELPQGWEYVRINQLMEPARDISYGIIKLEKEPEEGGIPTLRCSDVKPLRLDLTEIRRVSPEIEAEYQRTRLQGGEVLVNIRGTLGGVALVPSNLKGYNIAREVAMLPIHKEVDGMFIVNLMASPFFWSMIENNLKGIAYKGLNLGSLREFAIALPPLAEQQRIVAKVDELITLCDQLKAGISDVQATQLKLADALAMQVTGE